MITNLSIKNYAIIQELEVNFHPELNIITGETGAGKSILVGALNLILGKRADSSILRDEKQKCIVEGTFQIANKSYHSFFEEHDLDFEEETTIRREVRPNGKSRAFINDTPVNLDTLKKLTNQLVDLHEQHETQTLLDNKFYLNILDHLANQTSQVAKFRIAFADYYKKKKNLEILKDKIIQLQSNKDYLEFQFNELYDLGLSEADGKQLEDELNILENAEVIQETLADVIQILNNENETNLLDLHSDFASKIGNLGKFNKEFEEIQNRVESIAIELGDLDHEINKIANNFSIDDERLNYLKDRQNDINRLLQKHSLSDVEALIILQNELKQQVESLKFGEEDLEKLSDEVNNLKASLFKQAKSISSKRAKQIDPFKKSVEKILKVVGMPYASIVLNQNIKNIETINSSGIDEFELLFSANKGSLPQPLKKVASGGERSRLMLAVKSTIAGNVVLPTMIFDEIDTGISGEVAAKVGDIFKSLSQKHQIISITHLPQIAAKAKHHLFVYKDHSGEQTNTGIRILNKKEQILEIAKMLSGENPGKAAISAAKELIQ